MVLVCCSERGGGRKKEGSREYFVVGIICSPVPGQVLDVDRMTSKTALGHQQDLHPVIRTLYDHADVRYLILCRELWLWTFIQLSLCSPLVAETVWSSSLTTPSPQQSARTVLSLR